MIVFDDYKFIKYTEKHGFNNFSARNAALRSAAKVYHNKSDFKHFALSNMSGLFEDCITSKEKQGIINYYSDRFSELSPIVPHDVKFSKEELTAIMTVKGSASRKINAALLFLFKYFDTKNIKVSMKELRILCGVLHNYSWREISLIKNIVIMRASFGERIKPVNINLTKYKYSQTQCCTYRYNGAFCCPSPTNFFSNFHAFYNENIVNNFALKNSKKTQKSGTTLFL